MLTPRHVFVWIMLFIYCLSPQKIQSTEISLQSQKTVCLNMIVKNEKDVITRCLQSVLPFIDTWVIVDTGSTDGTQEIIKNFFKQHGIKGELFEKPWVDFSYNRNEALELAKDKADYLLFMDADDTLKSAQNFKLPPLTSDFYIILSVTSTGEHWSPRFIKTTLDWFWEGIIHEQLSCKTPVQGTPLFNIQYIYTQEGSRSKDPNTWKKDEELLLKSIQNNPEDPRNYFYLARTYMNENKLNTALTYFNKRIALQGNPEELFAAKLFIAKIQSILKFDPNIVKKSFFDTYLCRPHRWEPLYYLTTLLRQEGNHQKGYEISSLALKLPAISSDYYYLENWVYEFGLLFEFACCAVHTGHYEESLEACHKLLTCKSLPEALRKDTESWIQHINNLNTEKTKEKLISILN